MSSPPPTEPFTVTYSGYYSTWRATFEPNGDGTYKLVTLHSIDNEYALGGGNFAGGMADRRASALAHSGLEAGFRPSTSDVTRFDLRWPTLVAGLLRVALKRMGVDVATLDFPLAS